MKKFSRGNEDENMVNIQQRVVHHVLGGKEYLSSFPASIRSLMIVR